MIRSVEEARGLRVGCVSVGADDHDDVTGIRRPDGTGTVACYETLEPEHVLQVH